MDNEIIIEFSRTKEDAKKILFGKLWLRQIIPNVTISLLLLDSLYLVGLIFGAAINLSLGLDESTYFFTILFTIIVLNFFFAPVYKLYFFYKKQINEIYKDHKVIHIIFRITEDKFKYENENFSLEAPWTNTTMLKIDHDFIQFQSIVPKIYFWIPTSQISLEVKNHLLTKISKSKPDFKDVILKKKT